MRRDPPNPYRELPIPELEQAMQRRAGELLKLEATPRTKEERRDLARDTGYLLLAAAVPLMPADGHVPCTPERAIRHAAGTFQDEFLAAYELEGSSLRWQFLSRAKALHQALYGEVPHINLPAASRSTDAFREALAQLDRSASTLQRKQLSDQ